MNNNLTIVQQQAQSDDIMKRLAQLENDLKLKVDKNEFDNDLMKIRELIGNIHLDEEGLHPLVQSNLGGKKALQQFTEKEVSALKHIIEVFEKIEGAV